MKKILPLFLVLFSGFAYSQFNVSGLVVDALTKKEIGNVKILDVYTNNQVLTNSSGKFNINAHGKLEFSTEGYEPKSIELSNSKNLIVALNPYPNELDKVVINGLTIPVKQKYAVDAISLIDSEELNRGNGLALNPILNRIPGVYMQSGSLNTNKIVIRGIGARSLFGTSNIRAYFGDIPLTDGNGESSIEDLEIGSLSRIEIHKGPSSSSLGVGLGGTILLIPEYSDFKSKNVTISYFTGSYGLKRFIGKTSIGGKKSTTNIVFGNSHSDGYRMNNEYNRNTLTVTSKIYAGKNDNFSLIGSYVNLKSGIPSSLSQEDFDNNPRKAAFTWGKSKGYEDVDYNLLGLTWKHYYKGNLSQETSFFNSIRENYEPRPFNILEEKSNSFGIRSRIIGNFKLLAKELDWTFGSELFFDNYNNKTFKNLYQNYPEGWGSVQGDQLSGLDEKRNYYNFFAETNLKITEKLKLNLGVNVNQTLYSIKDRFIADGEDNSGDYNFHPIFSPKIGFNYSVNSTLIAFGNISHGFSTPTTAETLLPEGEFNPNIKPEIGWNYEIGSRIKSLNNKLSASISLYHLRIKDQLVSRRTTEDNFFAINAGKTNHNGIEAEIDYILFETENIKISTNMSASLNSFKFKEFVDLDNVYSGNLLTGVPSEVFNIGFDMVSRKGIFGNINFQKVGRIPVNDLNTVFSNAYNLLTGKIGYNNLIGKHLTYQLFIGLDNILNTKYASQIQVNATSFGNSAPRYFYPGLPFNLYGGFNLKYNILNEK